MEFAVIVVLDDAGACGFGKPQQFEAGPIGISRPVGYWCDGVTKISRGVSQGEEIVMPCASSGMAETLAPVERKATSAPP
jgi:hypothetical protein